MDANRCPSNYRFTYLTATIKQYAQSHRFDAAIFERPETDEYVLHLVRHFAEGTYARVEKQTDGEVIYYNILPVDSNSPPQLRFVKQECDVYGMDIVRDTTGWLQSIPMREGDQYRIPLSFLELAIRRRIAANPELREMFVEKYTEVGVTKWDEVKMILTRIFPALTAPFWQPKTKLIELSSGRLIVSSGSESLSDWLGSKLRGLKNYFKGLVNSNDSK